MATDNANSTVTVSWSDNSSNETGFELERQKWRKNGSWTAATTLLVSADVNEFTDASGTGTFPYRVRAVNAVGASAWTEWAQI